MLPAPLAFCWLRTMGLLHSGQNDELSGIFFPQLGQNMPILSCRDGADGSLQETF